MTEGKMVRDWVLESCSIDVSARYTARKLYETFCSDLALPDWPKPGAVSINAFSMYASMSHGDIERRHSVFYGLRPHSLHAGKLPKQDDTI